MESIHSTKGQKPGELVPTGQTLAAIFKIGFPTFIYFFSTIVIESINLIFVGHFGDVAMISGVSLGNMFLYTFGLTIVFGFNSVIETLASQTFGQSDLTLCGVYLNRGRVIAFLVAILCSCLMFLAKPLFLAINIDEDAVIYAQKYLIMLIPYLFLQTQVDIVAKWLCCFQKGYIVAIAQIITACFHVLWCYIFGIYFGWGLYGIAVAMNLNGIMNMTLTTLWVTFKEPSLSEAWFLPDRHCLAGLEDHFKMGLSACLMLSLEWWAFDLQIFLSTFISSTAIGVQCMVNNCLYLLMCFTYGLQYAGQILTGVSIGEKNIPQAYNYRKIVCIIGVIMAIVLSAFMYFARYHIAEAYTSITELSDMIAETFKVVALVHFWICCQLWLKGIIIALGKFSQANYGLLITCYFIATPIGCYLCFAKGLGINGLWWGYFFGLAILVFYYFYLVFFHFDWELIAEEAMERSMVQNEQLSKYRDTESSVKSKGSKDGDYQTFRSIREANEDEEDDKKPLIN